MKRREFVTLVGGIATAWPLTARAQQTDLARRIGVLFGGGETDPEFQARIAAFRQRLQQLGWVEGNNLRIEIRWATGETARIRKHASELVALAPDVILAVGGNPAIAALQQATRSIPIVFVGTTDPVGAGFVASLARPAGNITGFSPFEYGISAKWLELLKQLDPRVKRAGVLRDPANPTGIGFLAAMQGVAPSFGVELSPLSVQRAGDVEIAIAGFARGSNGGLIVTLSGATIQHRGLISTLAARHGLAAIYPYRYFVTGGGLISYGPNSVEPFRSAAGYVDRILKGEKPDDLPVQQPTKFELVINLKTAKALGLTVPLPLLSLADEVIE
jgi:putative ABC transport system substrate-binding protein